jgi:hypothetical protein
LLDATGLTGWHRPPTGGDRGRRRRAGRPAPPGRRSAPSGAGAPHTPARGAGSRQAPPERPAPGRCPVRPP